MNSLLRLIFDKLNQHNLAYCVLRDFDRLATMDVAGSELDLLIASDQVEEFDTLMGKLGFIALSRRWEYPHTHYIVDLGEGASEFEIDVVTQITFGNPVRELYTDLAERCLEQRRFVDGVYVPRPEDELLMLLLHCLLDKGQIKPHRAARIKALREQVIDQEYLTALFTQYWSPQVSWSQIDALIARGDWQELLKQRKAVALHLARQDRFGTWTRALSKRALRKLDRFARIIQSG